MFVTPTYAQFVKENKLLPSELRQRSVLIRFQQPFPDHLISEFYRIHFTDQMYRDGEDRFYQSEIFQPQNVETKLCPQCSQELKQVQTHKFKCINPRCVQPTGQPTSQLEFITGEVRGVIAVLTFPDFVIGREPHETIVGYTWESGKPVEVRRKRMMELLSHVLIVLDRRYDAKTLGGVKRTAGELAELLGYGIF